MIEQLFNIQIRHTYFSDGVFHTCEVIADSNTEKIISSYELMSSMEGGIFGLYTSCAGDAVGLLEYLNEQLRGEPLRFLLTADESSFVFITDLPLDWVGQIEFSSRSGVRKVEDGEAAIELVSQLSPRRVNQQYVIGVISIYLDDLLALGSQNIHYLIDFQARSLPWRYYLVNRSQMKLHSPKVCNQEQTFEGPEAVVLPNGEDGLCFSSGERKFPLQQIPGPLFDLVDRLPPTMDVEGDSVEHCLIQGLPTPSDGGLRQTEKSQQVFSAMYVYL